MGNLVDSEDFIQAIADSTKSGFGFTTLFGSGMSASAGIIMGMQFSGYLAYCVHQAVAGNPPWNFRKSNWPPFPSSKDYSTSLEWVRRQFKRLCLRAGYDVDFDNQQVAGIHVLPGRKESLLTEVDCPPVPMAIRSPRYYGNELRVQRLAQTLRDLQGRQTNYEPLWPAIEVSPSSTSHLVELAIRSLADWRSALHFLSRVVVGTNGTPRLAEPDDQVVNRFNSFIVADKQPTLGHKMLVQLSRPLRIRTHLTTNFDTLIEEAFAQAEMPLQKIAVSKEGRLPDPREVGSRVSIIKMHGEVAETRADMSLDNEPSDEDKRRFLGYFVDIDEATQNHTRVPSHLLVAGFSATDLRIVRFIQHLLDATRDLRVRDQPKVFWICFTEADVNRVKHFFCDEYGGRVVIHRSARADLLLHEMYQKVTLSLPPGGLVYEYSHNVPPNRYGSKRFNVNSSIDDTTVFANINQHLRTEDRAAPEHVQAARDLLSQLVGQSIADQSTGRSFDGFSEVKRLYRISNGLNHTDLESSQETGDVETGDPNRKNHDASKCCRSSPAAESSTANIVVFDMPSGALEAFSIQHTQFLSKVGRNCLWFELADYLDADSLLRDILRSIALRTGRYQREQVTLHPLQTSFHGANAQDRSKLEAMLTRYLTLMCETYHLTAADWMIMIYGREVAGSCVGWEGTPWRPEDWQDLAMVLQAFGKAGFRIAFTPPTDAKIRHDIEKWRHHVTKYEPNASYSEEHRAYVQKYCDEVKFAPEAGLTFLDGQEVQFHSKLSLFQHMRDAVEDRCDKDPEFADFFYAVTLFRQARRPTALFYEAVQPCSKRFNLSGIDNDLVRARKAAEWTRFLRELCIFYDTAGGHSWMHRDLRLIARARMDKQVLPGNPPRFRGQRVARLHFWIGDWYFKAFCSTGYALPIIECLHHRYQAALAAPYAMPKAAAGQSEEEIKQSVPQYRFSLLRSAILEIRKTLVIAQPYLKLWLANGHGMPLLKSSGAIHNLVDSTGKEVTIADRLKIVVEELTKGWPVEDYREELINQIDRLSSEIVAVDRSIREEANISCGELAYSGLKGASSPAVMAGFDAGFKSCIEHIYLDDFQESAFRSAIAKAVGEPEESEQVEELGELIDLNGQNGDDFEKEKYARLKAKCLASLGAKSTSLLPLLYVFEALAYLRLRRAKFKVHSKPVQNGHSPTSPDANDALCDKEVRQAWRRVTQLCNLAIDWCKHLPVESLSLEMELKVRLHSYYAVALANLDRFHEAHRHVNEASGINSKAESAAPRLGVTKLRLRRAEVYLTEAHRVACVLKSLDEYIVSRTPEERTQGLTLRAHLADKWTGVSEPPRKDDRLRVEIHPSIPPLLPTGRASPKEQQACLQDLSRLLTAILDDAWVRLEYAEKSLSGKSQSNLWWGRLAVMKLRAFSYQVTRFQSFPDSPVPMRMAAYYHRKFHPEAIWNAFTISFLNNGHCLYRRLRLIRYTAKALNVAASVNDSRDVIEGYAGELAKRRKDVYEELRNLANSKELGEIDEYAKVSIDELLRELKLDPDRFWPAEEKTQQAAAGA